MGTTMAVRQVQSAIEGRSDAAVRETFGEMLERYRPRMVAMCLRVTGDRALAQRVADDALRQLLFELPRLADKRPGRMRPRILGLAHRHAVEAVRRPGELLIQDGVIALDSPTGERLCQLSWSERCRAVSHALTGLDPPLRAAAHLRYVENLPHRSIASWLQDASAPRSLDRERQTLSCAIASVLA